MTVKLFIFGAKDTDRGRSLSRLFKNRVNEKQQNSLVELHATNGTSQGVSEELKTAAITENDIVGFIAPMDREVLLVEGLQDINVHQELDRAKATYLAMPQSNAFVDLDSCPIYTKDLVTLKPLPYKNTELTDFLHSVHRLDTKVDTREIATERGVNNSVYSIDVVRHIDSGFAFLDRMIQIAKAG